MKHVRRTDRSKPWNINRHEIRTKDAHPWHSHI